MLRPVIASALLVSLLSGSIAAQDLKNFGGPATRAEASMFIGDMTGGKFNGVFGAVAISYGQPEWKESWTAQAIDAQTKGKTFRLGKDNWATLDNSCPVTIGDTTIPAGIWYLAAARSKDGAAWSLVVIDPAKAKAAGAWPFQSEMAPHAYEARLTHAATTDTVQKLTIAFEPKADNSTQGTLSITWGNQKLTAPVEVKGAGKGSAKDAAGKTTEGEAKKR